MNYKAECSSLKQFQVSYHSNEGNLEAFTSKLLTYKIRYKKEAKGLCSMKGPDTRAPGSQVIYSASCASSSGLLTPKTPPSIFVSPSVIWYPSLPLLNYPNWHGGKTPESNNSGQVLGYNLFFPEMQKGGSHPVAPGLMPLLCL